ncbi:MAG TPA: phosphoglucosamine mutase [Pyrinomonadaceae bacterium]|nr:phosphoglucosamine mutase [Chloracidobacterium sp.]MBP9935286.1 phosphoglucosamine mutase [Pyrinomonadaceae bacterium]MBK7804564.1 phosphoglucosamine mutase [Chloracidobacterium sp.]MBL0240489.1 phosphoglucosamine mutase [Chloracidobacterium sp.]HQX56341.1 phosphoglucosamine mutase [Pyrinomonadaceae bacterium]
MKELFGTDGIRGRANEFPLDSRTIAVIGRSLARQFGQTLQRPPKFVIGRDTRESGEFIERAFCSGAESAGAECVSAGVITTPGVAFLTKAEGFDAGVVISASHNPFHDNGLKIFLPSGKKIEESIERETERDIYGSISDIQHNDDRLPAVASDVFVDDYVAHLTNAVSGLRAEGIKIVLDCANGAASEIAPRVFRLLGADVIPIHHQPDGRNINEKCGSLHLEHLQAAVIENGADLGVAFDGDADRALFVDENGAIVDGDATLWAMAQYLKGHGRIQNSKVVATVMSNIGLEIAMRSIGIELIRAAVGDKYVLQQLLETDSEVGGEQSGHVIFARHSLVGDGIMTALFMLRAMVEKGVTLSHMADGFVRYPQVLVNVKVSQKLPFESVPAIAAAAKAVEDEIMGEGRLLLRYSGTENLARVMIEGKDQAQVETQANRIADVIRAEIGLDD